MVENPAGPVLLRARMGSFDCVRLAPHYAQDDNRFCSQHKKKRRCARL